MRKVYSLVSLNKNRESKDAVLSLNFKVFLKSLDRSCSLLFVRSES